MPKSLNIRLINTFSFLLGTYSLSFLVNFSEDFMFSGEEQGKIKLTRARKRRCFSSHVQESQRDRVQGSFCISYPNLIFSLLSCSSMSLKLFFFFFSRDLFLGQGGCQSSSSIIYAYIPAIRKKEAKKEECAPSFKTLSFLSYWPGVRHGVVTCQRG